MEGDKLKYADGTHTAVHAAVKDDSYECCTCCHQTPINWLFLRSSCTVPDIAQCPRCQLGIALNRARSDLSQIVGFVV